MSGNVKPETVRESLANYAHEAWAGWMKYLFGKSIDMSSGAVVIPGKLVKRWTRQMNTPYSGLPENEKESDRAEADKILEISGFASLTEDLARAENDARDREAVLSEQLNDYIDKCKDAEERARVTEEALTALKVHVGIPHDTPDDEVADRLLGIAQPYTDIDVDALIFAFNMVYTSPTWGGDERSPEGWKQKEAALRKAFTSTSHSLSDKLAAAERRAEEAITTCRMILRERDEVRTALAAAEERAEKAEKRSSFNHDNLVLANEECDALRSRISDLEEQRKGMVKMDTVMTHLLLTVERKKRNGFSKELAAFFAIRVLDRVFDYLLSRRTRKNGKESAT